MIVECVGEHRHVVGHLLQRQEVFQIAINLLGDKFYDVQLNRAASLPGVALAIGHLQVDGSGQRGLRY